MGHATRRHREAVRDVMALERDRPYVKEVATREESRPSMPAAGLRERAAREAQSLAIIIRDMEQTGCLFRDGRSIDDIRTEHKEAEYLARNARGSWDEIDSDDAGGHDNSRDFARKMHNIRRDAAAVKPAQRKKVRLTAMYFRLVDQIKKHGEVTIDELSRTEFGSVYQPGTLRKIACELANVGLLERIPIEKPGSGPRWRWRAVAS